LSLTLDSKGSTRNFIKENRETLVLACTALTITFFLVTRGFRGDELYLGWIFLGLAFGLSKKSIGNKWIFGGLVFLLLSHALAVPGSIWWGRGHWEMTLYHTIWIIPFILLYLINTSEKIYLWLIPILVLHSSFIIVEYWIKGFGLSDKRIGLLDNANPASALLTIGIIFLLNTKFKWITPLLVVALLLNGQRSGLGTLAIMIGIIILVTLIRKQWTVLLGIVLVIGVGLGVIISSDYGEKASIWSGSTLQTGLEDLVIRWEVTDTPSIFPKGLTKSLGLHALVERIAVELGILAAIVWIGVTFYSLLQKPWFNTSWWVLLTILVISITEYSVWLGPLSAIWWVTIGLRIKTNAIS
jgi:hypothetical protein